MTLCPTDEGANDATFAEYRKRLMAAVEQKNWIALTPLLARDFRVNFGDGGGIEAFREQWKPDSPDSKLWAELREILEHGGSFAGEDPNRVFWAPYVYSRWPEDIDAFEHVAVLRADVPLRSAAADDAPVVRTLDWSIVRLAEPATGDQPWRHVSDGWISAKDVRSPIDYRAAFGKVNGEWKMIALVAGD